MADIVTADREKFASRLGFILISAGCAIGLGNIWRFPYITGEYGGAAFVVMYLVFLVILGLPVMVMEFSVGRASQRSTATAFNVLQPSGKWGWFGWVAFIGCLILMMFYTTVCGWFLNYVVKMATGTFNGLDPDGVANVFGTMLADPSELIAWMLFTVILGFLVCSLGLQKGVERITKVMMLCLLILLVVLVVRAVTLPGAEAGLEFYLLPDFGALFQGATPSEQFGHFGEAVYAAMGQAFFTLSLGIGSMEIFGSYIDKDRSITGESLRISVPTRPLTFQDMIFNLIEHFWSFFFPLLRLPSTKSSPKFKLNTRLWSSLHNLGCLDLADTLSSTKPPSPHNLISPCLKLTINTRSNRAPTATVRGCFFLNLTRFLTSLGPIMRTILCRIPHP